jgi:hypothetical protein
MAESEKSQAEGANEGAKPPPLPSKTERPSPGGMVRHCPKCSRRVELGDLYCRHCGSRLHWQSRGEPQAEAWYLHPVAIILLGFLVLGPFVLPLVWRSPLMPTWGKWTLTILLLAYTAFLVVLTIWVVNLVMGSLQGYTDLLYGY